MKIRLTVKNSRGLLPVVPVAALFFLALLFTGCTSRFVTLRGKQFRDRDGKEFYPLACNYLVVYAYTGKDTSSLILSPDPSVDGPCFDCTDTKSCLDEMSRNFDRIREMGFNAIRLFGTNPNYYCKRGSLEAWRIRAYDLSYAMQSKCDIKDPAYSHDYYFGPPFSSNPIASKVFALTDSVLVRAAKAGLYVILVSGGGAGDFSINYPQQYAKYLSELGRYIRIAAPLAAREALMAYDLDNEPSNSWSMQTQWPVDTIGHSKEEVHDHVKLFSTSLKKADPDHLTTIGGRSFDEVFEYDPSILEVDFYSAHFYPLKKSYDASPFADRVSRVQGHIIWLSEILEIPFIVGETGFRSEPGGNGPDGTNEEQKRYAEISLDMTRFYGGSGYSWWNYQDYNWGKFDGYYGLTYLDPKTGTVKEKPAAEIFRHYDPNRPVTPFVMPGNYYDPYSHRRFNPSRNHLSGHVQDTEGKPVKNAVILGWTPIATGTSGSPQYEPHYTFSDENGDFTLIPYDSDPVSPPNSEVIVEVRVTAAGYSRFKTGWHDDLTGVPPEKVKIVTLKKLKFR